MLVSKIIYIIYGNTFVVAANVEQDHLMCFLKELDLIMPVIHEARDAVNKNHGLALATNFVVNWCSIKCFEVTGFFFDFDW